MRSTFDKTEVNLHAVEECFKVREKRPQEGKPAESFDELFCVSLIQMSLFPGTSFFPPNST